MIIGLLLIFTVAEPHEKKHIVLTKDKSVAKEVAKEADQQLQAQGNKDLEVKQVGEQVVLHKKTTTFKQLARNYKEHFTLILTNKAAMMLILASFFKLWQTMAQSFYLSEFMKTYKHEYQEFSAQAAASSFIAGLLSTFICGVIVDYFGPKSDMTIPVMCMFKAALDIPAMCLIFYKPNNFIVSMIGIHMHNLVGQGWSSSAILMLKTISDPRVAYLAISFFLVLTSICSVVVSLSTAIIIDIFDLDSIKTPDKFGLMLTLTTTIPLALCLPFFYYSGLNFKAKQ